MKKTLVFIIVISFLVAVLTSYGVAGENEIVRDSYGDPLKFNVPYIFLISVPPIQRTYWLTRLIRSPPLDGECQDHPIGLQTHARPDFIRFTSSSSSDVIRVGDTKVNIKFVPLGVCDDSGIWRVKYTQNGPARELFLNGAESSDDSIFTIEKSLSSDRDYRLAFPRLDRNMSNPIGLFLTARPFTTSVRIITREILPSDNILRYDLSFLRHFN